VTTDDDDNDDDGKNVARDPFDALQLRFMSLRTRLNVLSEVLSTGNLPFDFQEAGFVLRETAEEVVDLCHDLEFWHGEYEHSPKEAPPEVELRRSVFRARYGQRRQEINGPQR